jgi:hypothetical protein
MRAKFKQLAMANWSKPVKTGSSLDVWQEKVRGFRKWSKG